MSFNARYADLARSSPDGLYAVMAKCPAGHFFRVYIDGDGFIRRVSPGDVEDKAGDCELVGDVSFLPPIVRQRVVEALKTGNYQGLERIIEDLKRMGLVVCL